MENDLLKSALFKCKQAQKALWLQSTIDEHVTYASFIKKHVCSGGDAKALRQSLKTVSDLVTEEELEQLLSYWPFSWGWGFTKRYICEERLGLNDAMHEALALNVFHLPLLNLVTKADVQKNTLVEMPVCTSAFRLIEIFIDVPSQSVPKCDDFLVELTDNQAFLLHLRSDYYPPRLDAFCFSELPDNCLAQER